MLSNEEKELINCIIDTYKNSSDFREENYRYNILIERINNSLISNKIKQLEDLLKQRNYSEYFYAYQQGYLSKKEEDENNLFDKGVDETIGLTNLNKEFDYICTLKKIRTLKRAITSYYENSNNFSMLENVYKLFEIYNNINYEILKLSYISGYCITHNLIKINSRLIEYKPSIKLSAEQNSISTNIGQKIYHCRKCLEYTQTEMSSLFSINRSSLSKYEKGRSTPQVEILLYISENYNISLFDLCSPEVEINKFKIKYPKSHFLA